ncbi:MAG: VOC family protein [Gammaproteobacteria bacterium]|nr:VOC family protein [Gammaproteobacteria bacterium]
MAFPSISLSHVELYVRDVAVMEAFYTSCLGFVVTDRGDGEDGMVFLSRNPDEHHQLVLNPRSNYRVLNSQVDHISFRTQSFSELRYFYEVMLAAMVSVDAVSHGTTWSLYFRDPEGNRFEVFVDTPWYVNQPCKFKVDMALSDEELYAFTEEKVKAMPGFCAVESWKALHTSSLTC